MFPDFRREVDPLDARQVNPMHFQVFDLHVMQQWPLLRVTRELRVSPASTRSTRPARTGQRALS